MTHAHTSVPSSTPAAVFLNERWDDSPAPEMEWEFPIAPGTSVEVRLYLSSGFDAASQPVDRQFDNNRIEWDHGRLKARLKPMRGLSTDRTASMVIRGHAFVQNLRRGHYELGAEADRGCLRLAAAFDELADVI
ncbi:MAG: DDE-type integrase/transposase/recombinase [bacterium]|nr:DDE-type integrase/transposase/recombinase [bacterium]